MGTLGFTQLYAPNHDRKVAAVFYGCDKQPHLGSDGDQKNLDTWWIYYTDGTFEQFAIMDDDPADRVVLFSEGEYQLREGSSFAYEHAGEADYITIHRTKKYTQGGLTSYDSIHEYELGTLGFVRIVVIPLYAIHDWRVKTDTPFATMFRIISAVSLMDGVLLDDI